MQPRDVGPASAAEVAAVVARRAPAKPAATGDAKIVKRTIKATPKRAAAKKPVALPMTVVASVKRDIEAIAERDPKLATSGLAALALSLAREMDAKNSATSKSMCARALAETLERLAELAPPAPAQDGVDQLAAKRNARLSA